MPVGRNIMALGLLPTLLASSLEAEVEAQIQSQDWNRIHIQVLIPKFSILPTYLAAPIPTTKVASKGFLKVGSTVSLGMDYYALADMAPTLLTRICSPYTL